MTSKPQTPGSKPTTASTAQQSKSKDASGRTASTPKSVNRAGSAGGVVLDGHTHGKSAKVPPPRTAAAQGSAPDAAATPTKPRRKPRKLNKEPTPVPTQNVASPIKPATKETDATANAELEALKSRVRGLEAKVEQLYSSTESKAARSPRRRGKGRKGSSSVQPPIVDSTPDTTSKVTEINEEDEEVIENLVRLEGELRVARHDLEAYRPRPSRTRSQDTDDIEEIPREGIGLEDVDNSKSNNRHVTLSGSYRIPLPTSVSMDDVRTIQSGVSAAHNVARSFLEQRRTAVSLREQQGQSNPPASRPTRPSAPRALSSSMEVAVATNEEGEKQSWSEWIGGYSMAISRAVKSIEHEALVESQAAGDATGRTAKTTVRPGNTSTPKKKSSSTKRPATKAKLSSDQVQTLVS